ncbi:hypothetical protein ACHHYP_06193 [Achlya hypogyna]|uniref:Uncharacterized protein n=1 Tax=Achlya hypogyna TaxID=1202772 RepID=A0A1V9YV77_ACHHY|nr:hypothetical protein ACHHYP_06193 [Achlya hypogyna]
MKDHSAPPLVKRPYLFVGGTVAALLTLCVLLDSTSFFLHLSVYVAFVATACVGHIKVCRCAAVGRPLAVLSYMALAAWWPWPGLVRIALSTLALVGVTDVVSSALVPGTAAVTGALLAMFVLYTQASLWAGLIVGAAALAFYHRRHPLTLQPVVHGSLLATTVTVGAACFGIWVVLSMNPFWLRANEVSKFDALHYLDPDATLDATRIGSRADLQQWYAAAPRQFPYVIKPNVCTTSSAGVRLCHDVACLETYVAQREATGTRQDDTSWVIQKAATGLEAVVFFYKYPYGGRGEIKTIGLRDKSREEGADGNDLRANYFTSNGEHLRTDAFLEYFRNITDHFPGYSGGRFDVILESEALAREGRGIGVVEVNIFPLGDIDEKKDTWTAKLRALRTLGLQFWMGYTTILGGYQPDPLVVVKNISRLVERYYQCQNHENLYAVP